MTAHLELRNVSKILGGREVLRNISFALPRKRSIAVIGSSGSGKSTLLRAINRLIEIDGGAIYLFGQDTSLLGPISLRRTVVLVPQKPEMFPGSVYKNLRYAMDLKSKYDKKKIMNALTDAGLDSSFLYRDAKKLSVGEQQRVAIARALTLEPEVLLLDEPTSALDTKLTRRFEATIKRLKRSRGLSIIWVTHDLAQARRVGDLIAELKKGRLKQFGDVDTILAGSTKHGGHHHPARGCCIDG
jgi:ABC-type multidrug transport system ATPase subunit